MIARESSDSDADTQIEDGTEMQDMVLAEDNGCRQTWGEHA